MRRRNISPLRTMVLIDNYLILYCVVTYCKSWSCVAHAPPIKILHLLNQATADMDREQA